MSTQWHAAVNMIKQVVSFAFGSKVCSYCIIMKQSSLFSSTSPTSLPPKNCQLVNQGGIVNLTRNLMKQLFISFFVFLCSPLQQTSRVPSHIPRTLLAGIPRIWQKINQTFFLNQHRTTWKVSIHEVTTAVLSYRFVTLVSRLVNNVPHAHFLKSPSWIQAKVNIILILVCTWSDKLSIKSWRE